MDSTLLVYGIAWYVIFLFSTTCHEAAHAWAAHLGGDPTAFHGGQVSLDPIPHIRREFFGMVVFPILTYITGGWMMGWASAPYDPLWASRHPRRAAWMSLAGPCANLTLTLIAALLIHVGLSLGAFHYPDSISFTHIVEGASEGAASGAAFLLSICFSLNLLLFVFNLLPLPPLDGFSAVGVLLPESAASRLQKFGWQLGAFAMLGILVAWRIFDPIFDPIFSLSLRCLYPGQFYGG